MPSVSIKDVAARSGVSYKTVSRVVNGEGTVRAETRQRVLDAIEELDYRPHQGARSLRRGRADALRFVPHQRGNRFAINPFQDEVTNGIVDVARRANLAVMLEVFDPADDSAYIRERFRNRTVDGNILLDGRVPFPLEDELRLSGVPSVVIANMDLDPALGWVYADFEGGGRGIVEHLLDLGHTRIAHLADDPQFATSASRLRGYQAALASRGIPFDSALVIEAGQLRHEGATATQTLLDRGIDFTAIYSVNDLTAFGAIETLMRHGLRVPEDVSVTGYDDLDYAQYVVPALTTVHIPWYEMSVAATESVLDVVEGRSSELIHEIFPVELRIRESTGPAPSRR